MSQGYATPATHVAVTCIGSDVVNSFVFDDGIAESQGVAVMMTPSVIRATLQIFEQMKSHSKALIGTRPSVLNRPQGYRVSGNPVAAHAVSAVVTDDSGVVVLGFRSIDFVGTLERTETHERVPIQTSLATIVALSASVFLAWVAELTERQKQSDDEGKS